MVIIKLTLNLDT